jgi:arylsulfatase A-like enzyme
MSRRLGTLLVPGIAWAVGLLICPTGRAGEPPQILLIYIDNVGYGDLGCYGHPEVRTPRIDRLAAEGVRCTDFYVSTSSCTPSRGALLTGRYPLRNGLTHQLKTEENKSGIGLPHRERLIPQELAAAGYVSACFGKWNIGFAPGSRPTERGFDEFFGFRSGNINYYTHRYAGEYDIYRGTDVHPVNGYSTDLFADAACEFMRRRTSAGQHWFVYLAFNAAHFVGANNVPPGVTGAWQVPARYLEAYGWPADEPDPQRRYWAVLTALDDALGRVLDTVDELGVRDSTLVWLISDNGAFMLPGRGLEVASNGPLRSGGTTCYEGGIRVPAMVRWPHRLPESTVCREPLSHLDILPMCLAAAGLPTPKDRTLDGADPTATLAGKAPTPHARLYFSFRESAGCREGRWKIVRSRTDDPWELYDLAQDRGERNNLADSHPDRVADLSAAFDRWQMEVTQP